jgi:very-short-patch-repair endonuclease
MQIITAPFTKSDWSICPNGLDYETCLKRMNQLNSGNFKQELRFIEVCGNIFDDSLVFFRNYPLIGRYFGDFVCIKKMIVIEINENYHLSPIQKQKDRLRRDALKKAGFSVLTLWQNDSNEKWYNSTLCFFGKTTKAKKRSKKAFKAARRALRSSKKNYTQLMAAARKRDKLRREQNA